MLREARSYAEAMVGTTSTITSTSDYVVSETDVDDIDIDDDSTVEADKIRKQVARHTVNQITQRFSDKR